MTDHHLLRLWRAAGSPDPLDPKLEPIKPRKHRGTICAVTGLPDPEFAYGDALSTNFVLARFARLAFPLAADSEIRISSSRSEPALHRCVVWAIRSLAFRSATWVFDGEDIEFCPMRRFPRGDKAKVPEHVLRAAFGGRTCDDWIDWLLQPRPIGTIAALPAYGIDHGGESNFHRLPWPTGCRKDPLSKLQSKHTVLFVQPSLDVETLRLQVDDNQTLTLDIPTWQAFARNTREAVERVLALLPEAAQKWPIARSLIERGPSQLGPTPPAVVEAVADFHRRHYHLIRSPFWPHMIGALYPKEK